MLRRKLAVLVAAALLGLMLLVVSAMPAFAQEGLGPSECSQLQGFQGRVFIASDAGSYSGEFNPGNSNNPANDLSFLGPLVPYAFNCNPPHGELG